MQQSFQSLECVLVIAERSASDMQHSDTSGGQQQQHLTAHEELQNCMQELERSQGTSNWLLCSTSAIARKCTYMFNALLWLSHLHRLDV